MVKKIILSVAGMMLIAGLGAGVVQGQTQNRLAMAVNKIKQHCQKIKTALSPVFNPTDHAPPLESERDILGPNIPAGKPDFTLPRGYDFIGSQSDSWTNRGRSEPIQDIVNAVDRRDRGIEADLDDMDWLEPEESREGLAMAPSPREPEPEGAIPDIPQLVGPPPEPWQEPEPEPTPIAYAPLYPIMLGGWDLSWGPEPEIITYYDDGALAMENVREAVVVMDQAQGAVEQFKEIDQTPEETEAIFATALEPEEMPEII
jgi:hypothetical protein